MPNSDFVADNLIAAPKTVALHGADLPETSGVATVSGGVFREARARWAKLSDTQVALLVSAVLFVFGAWPLLLAEVPPFQDLPNHLAAVTVIQNPERYPEFVFNGFFKTNAALFAWLYVVGKVTGVSLAAKLFAVLVVAANAFVFPRFVLALTGSRNRMLVASLFMWPFAHNWFVSMGMLDFAFAVPLSLSLLILLERQRRAPTVLNAVGIVGLGAITWYAHVFPLLVVHLLVMVEVVTRKTWKERTEFARAMILPLLPVTVLVTTSLYHHLSDTVGPMTGFIDSKRTLPVWELCYNMWAEWFWGFSYLQLSSLLPCLALAAIGIWRRKESPAFFSPAALVTLVVLYAFVPYILTNWFHVNSRIIPFIWTAFLLRVPAQLPKKFAAVLGIAALAYTAGMGVDYVRLERERREFTAGIQAVPEGARLLPLLFSHKIASENTRTILHAWGYYVEQKKTAAPLLFAHSHSFPVTYSAPPPVRFNHLVLEGFASSMARPSAVCRGMLDGNIVVDDCENAYRTAWHEFWTDAMPRYDYLLLWDITPEARDHLPAAYGPVFEQGRLAIYARRGQGDGERALVP